ncbi:MAG: hypothetical protein A2096_01855 [Spirochaetes bacterium GWF1_41_5]|nr:MAG: hypothetical protein A2096_01855 [Spirochaetes bacterium GWF1_41_5]
MGVDRLTSLEILYAKITLVFITIIIGSKRIMSILIRKKILLLIEIYFFCLYYLQEGMMVFGMPRKDSK